MCVINTPGELSWGDLRGLLGFSVSELTGKCPFMEGFFSISKCQRLGPHIEDHNP